MSILPREINTLITNFIIPSNGSREEIRKCGMHLNNLSLVNKDWMDVCKEKLSNLKKDYELLPLGYPAANDFQLFRNKEGIISQAEMKCKFIGLFNYPTTVRFSKRAIRKMNEEFTENGNRSSINVYVNLKSGKKMEIFGINTNFFGRVQKDRNTDKASIDYNVSTFKYDSSDKTFETVFGCERAFIENDWKTDNGDVVTMFGAEYLLGYVTANEIHKFTAKFFNADELGEKIILEIGVKENDDWDLSIHQRQLL